MKKILTVATVVLTLAFAVNPVHARPSGLSAPGGRVWQPNYGHYHYGEFPNLHFYRSVPSRGGYVYREAPLQTKKFVAVVNNTADKMTVYLRLPSEDATHQWTVEPGERRYLAIDGLVHAYSKVYLWAKTGGREWNTYKDDLLSLVPEPYRAYTIRNYSHTFK